MTDAPAQGAAEDPPPPAAAPPTRGPVMLASEGRPFERPVVDRAVALAREHGAELLVISIARVHGSSLGFPNPWLNPSRQEWDEQKTIVTRAVKAGERAGLHAYGIVLATRRPGKRILKEARLRKVEHIVMGCDESRGRIRGDFLWSQEPQRIARRARGVAVHLVPLR